MHCWVDSCEGTSTAAGFSIPTYFTQAMAAEGLLCLRWFGLCLAVGPFEPGSCQGSCY